MKILSPKQQVDEVNKHGFNYHEYIPRGNILCQAQYDQDMKEVEQAKQETIQEFRKAIAIEYHKAVIESKSCPFPNDNLNNEHKLLYKGHANAYSETLVYLDNLKSKYLKAIDKSP
jgi:hypothetical protein